ncbi:hypothetical protein HK102_007470, partial [Quaeritorhiza haematococci]
MTAPKAPTFTYTLYPPSQAPDFVRLTKHFLTKHSAINNYVQSALEHIIAASNQSQPPAPAEKSETITPHLGCLRKRTNTGSEDIKAIAVGDAQGQLFLSHIDDGESGGAREAIEFLAQKLVECKVGSWATSIIATREAGGILIDCINQIEKGGIDWKTHVEMRLFSADQ